ncbi:MAG TPA: CoA transferase [Ktedonobacteraceae bacterium]|nr:CoA transferase [Ktedonobacteraceae bacterium]
MDEQINGPLAGVRVIDLTSIFMGPFATQMLGDFGADVIKVEPILGDVVRAVGPHGDHGMGAIFLHANRNKRSIALNLKAKEGLQALLALVKQADVLVYSIRPDAMNRLGLGYDKLREVNARIIYVGAFGFSQRGPYASAPALDDAIQAAIALPHAALMNGSNQPRYAPVTIVDRSVGLYTMGVVCAALYARERTGVGQAVDVPMFETMTHYIFSDHLYGHTFVPAEGDFGYPRLLNTHRRPYKTKDGYACIVVYSDANWRHFLDLIGKAELLQTDPRLHDLTTRTKHSEDIYKFVADELEKRTTAEWQAVLRPLGIPFFPMHTFESLLEDEHLAAIGFFQEVEHPTEGRIRMMACPSEWSETHPGLRYLAPRLGEHSREILLEAGYQPAEIDALVAAGVTYEAGPAPHQ